MKTKTKLDLILSTFAVCSLVTMVCGTFGAFLITAFWVTLIPVSVILFEYVKENQTIGGEDNE